MKIMEPTAHSVFPDLTEAKNALTLQTLDSLSTRLLDEVDLGIMVMDAGNFLVARNAALSLYLPHVPQTLGGLVRKESLSEEIFALVEKVRQSGKAVTSQLTEKKSRLEILHQVQIKPFTEAGPGAICLLAEDVTERVQLERIRTDFVTNASHELRTPLSLIHGYIETLKSGMFKGSNSMLRCLDVMEKHSRRMMRIIEDMLTISRLESVDTQLQCLHFCVRTCISDVLEHLTPMIDLRQPVIHVDLPRNGMMQGDRFYWDQIFTNLIENALKENQVPGLTITVKGVWREKDIVLSVADNGVGIPLEDQPFVFKRFFRCAKHHSQDIKGTGLGLSIVRRAVEAHGGKIVLRSIPGVETVFEMTVPH